MPQGVTAKCITAEQNDVDREDECSDSNSKSVRKPKRFPNIDTQNDDENECEIKKIAVHVLHDEREGTLTEISFARFAHRAGRRIGPERLVVGAAIVITGESETARRPQN